MKYIGFMILLVGIQTIHGQQKSITQTKPLTQRLTRLFACFVGRSSSTDTATTKSQVQPERPHFYLTINKNSKTPNSKAIIRYRSRGNKSPLSGDTEDEHSHVPSLTISVNDIPKIVWKGTQDEAEIASPSDVLSPYLETYRDVDGE